MTKVDSNEIFSYISELVKCAHWIYNPEVDNFDECWDVAFDFVKKKFALTKNQATCFANLILNRVSIDVGNGSILDDDKMKETMEELLNDKKNPMKVPLENEDDNSKT